MSLGRGIDAVFLAADLVGYTALTEAMGGGEAVKVIARYVELAEAALARDVRIVERVGDELLVVAAEPMFPEVRAGIHGGTVIEREGKYFGAALNLTARLAVYAQPGQVLCTEHIAAACRGTQAFECQAIGPVRFKNVVGPVDVFEIVTKQRPGGPMVLDPVCRMQIRPGTAPARQSYAGTTYSSPLALCMVIIRTALISASTTSNSPDSIFCSKFSTASLKSITSPSPPGPPSRSSLSESQYPPHMLPLCTHESLFHVRHRRSSQRAVRTFSAGAASGAA